MPSQFFFVGHVAYYSRQNMPEYAMVYLSRAREAKVFGFKTADNGFKTTQIGITACLK